MAAKDESSDLAVETVAEVGTRIKMVRRARRMTIEAVAEASGLTKSFVSKVERGRSTPSVAALLRIAAALDISLASLFENSATRHVVRADEYPRVDFGGTGLEEFLLTPHAERRMQVILSRIEPGGGSGDELYQLPGEVEFLYVIDGPLDVTYADGTTTLNAGDAITFEPSAHHAFAAPADGSGATVLWTITPALSQKERRGDLTPENP